VRSILLTFAITVSTATVVSSDITDEVVYWMEEANSPHNMTLMVVGCWNILGSKNNGNFPVNKKYS